MSLSEWGRFLIMLKHEDIPQPQTPSPSAAQVRVTPEELAAAVTALQIRKEGQPGTIAIGDAVEELGLDVTPEEVLAEVQARRAKPKRRRDYRALACAFACVAMFGVGDIVASQRYDAPQIATVSSVDTTQVDTLNEVEDEQQFFVDTHGLRQIIEGIASSQVQVYPDSQGIHWGIIKHNGKVYVQAYTFSTTERKLKSETADLYNSEDQVDEIIKADGEREYTHETVKITLPIQSFHYEDSQITSGRPKAMITVTNIHPDNHLWDSFVDNIAK